VTNKIHFSKSKTNPEIQIIHVSLLIWWSEINIIDRCWSTPACWVTRFGSGWICYLIRREGLLFWKRRKKKTQLGEEKLSSFNSFKIISRIFIDNFVSIVDMLNCQWNFYWFFYSITIFVRNYWNKYFITIFIENYK